ncbi:hypothetical protein DUI87_32482 [Hirundo rustica rustica]|uniref:Uncharacterized protein n=1 Tax=Hirundo rustica rustica TaxID=333673 RepID=A0A3M0IX82_HIRRU|nr:hypothetical protein DUI87_32482 [Hirundo rustica rustica]
MAAYVPGLLPANRSQEKEFVQAYEDVLERYKAEQRGGSGWKMNLEKYKKFLDGLGTLRGICDPGRGERLSRWVPPSVTDRQFTRIECPWHGQEEL